MQCAGKAPRNVAKLWYRLRDSARVHVGTDTDKTRETGARNRYDMTNRGQTPPAKTSNMKDTRDLSVSEKKPSRLNEQRTTDLCGVG